MNTHPLLEKMASCKNGINLVWLGNLGWLLCSNGLFFAFDLDLDLDLRLSEPAIPVEDIASVLKILFITHEHDDHFNRKTAKALVASSECHFVLPATCVQKAKEIGISAERMLVARPGTLFTHLGVTVEPMHALHGHLFGSVYNHANFDDCGYALTVEDLRLLQPGDTVLLQEHLEANHVDVLFVSLTEHNTNIEQSRRLIQAVTPRYIFPQHFGTYRQTAGNTYWTRGYAEELYASLTPTMQSRFHTLAQGTVFKIARR